MATYKYEYDFPNSLNRLDLEEFHMYGSSRIGTIQLGFNLYDNDPNPSWTEPITNLRAGHKRYELTNHLGNVMAVVNDRTQGIHADADGIIDYYEATVLKANDYYPFGSYMPGREYTFDDYRFSFNGQERTDEIAGTGNHTTALYWEYDTRLGRRWNLDPLTTEFPWQSGYSSLDNNPVLLNDLFGASADHYEVDKETGESRYVKDAFGEDVVFTLFGKIDEDGKFYRRYGDEILVHSDNTVDWEIPKSSGSTSGNQGGGYTLPYYRPGYKPDYTFSDVSQQIIWNTAVTLATAEIPVERVVSGAIGIFAKTSKPVLEVAAKGGSNILGQTFGRLGTVVENPNIGVKMLDEDGHYLVGKINRMVPSADVIGTLKNPSVVLQQANGRFLYLSQKAGVVINQNGKLITT